jgi:hypothetical protein
MTGMTTTRVYVSGNEVPVLAHITECEAGRLLLRLNQPLAVRTEMSVLREDVPAAGVISWCGCIDGDFAAELTLK